MRSDLFVGSLVRNRGVCLVEAGSGQMLEPLGLSKERSPKPLADLSLTDRAGEGRDSRCPAGDARIRVLAFLEDLIRNNAKAQRRWQLDRLRRGDVAFVENRLILSHVRRRVLQLEERPHLDLGHLERIEDIHRYGVSPLVGQVAPNATAQAFVGLAHVDRLFVVVVEEIDTVPGA